MKQINYGLTLFFAVISVLSGCGRGRGNGLPSDLTAHMSERGIKIAPSSVHAPLSSRAGYIVAPHNAQLCANIISTFKLEKIRPEDRLWKFASLAYYFIL